MWERPLKNGTVTLIRADGTAVPLKEFLKPHDNQTDCGVTVRHVYSTECLETPSSCRKYQFEREMAEIDGKMEEAAKFALSRAETWDKGASWNASTGKTIEEERDGLDRAINDLEKAMDLSELKPTNNK